MVFLVFTLKTLIIQCNEHSSQLQWKLLLILSASIYRVPSSVTSIDTQRLIKKGLTCHYHTIFTYFRLHLNRQQRLHHAKNKYLEEQNLSLNLDAQIG